MTTKFINIIIVFSLFLVACGAEPKSAPLPETDGGIVEDGSSSMDATMMDAAQTMDSSNDDTLTMDALIPPHPCDAFGGIVKLEPTSVGSSYIVLQNHTFYLDHTESSVTATSAYNMQAGNGNVVINNGGMETTLDMSVNNALVTSTDNTPVYGNVTFWGCVTN